MLSGISLSGPIGEVLAAAALVIAGFASIWACSKVIAIFRNDGGFDGSSDSKRSRAENLARTREGWLGGDLWHDPSTRRHMHNYWRSH